MMFSLVWLMLIGLFSSLLGFLYNMSEYENNNYNVLIKTKKNSLKKNDVYPQTFRQKSTNLTQNEKNL